MTMEKLGLNDARQIAAMLRGDEVPMSRLSARMVQALQQEGLVTARSNGSRRRLFVGNAMHEACRIYLSQHYGIDGPLERWIDEMERQRANHVGSRAELVGLTGSSKYRRVRTFRGFLVNSYTTIEATLGGMPFSINPIAGSALFVSVPDEFSIPDDVVVVGIENAENFMMIRRQKALFDAMLPGRRLLFASRYPQNSNLRTWLMRVSNRYVHFGDFDLAGIHIFLTEFHAFLGDRASFLIPPDIERRLANGNADLYNQQYARFKNMSVADERLQPLVDMLHRYRKGYEQEGYIE